MDITFIDNKGSKGRILYSPEINGEYVLPTTAWIGGKSISLPKQKIMSDLWICPSANRYYEEMPNIQGAFKVLWVSDGKVSITRYIEKTVTGNTVPKVQSVEIVAQKTEKPKPSLIDKIRRFF